MHKTLEKTSKFLSYVLRHKPEAIGLTLDQQGWANIDELIQCAQKNNEQLDYELLLTVVKTSDKKRFALSPDGLKIRASQGHSTHQVHIDYKEQIPPEYLFHGTATRFLDSILEQGLIPQSRHHVHLSSNKQTAIMVGKRHGQPTVLRIDALSMYKHGFKFYLSDNGVWLTEMVPSNFIHTTP